MKITIFHRNRKAGYSIYKVFSTLTAEIAKNKALVHYFVPDYRANMLAVINNIYYVYRNRDKTGVNHISGDIHYCILALIGCKTVLTIHDLSAMDCAQNPLKKAIIRWLWFKLPLRFADKVICISEATKRELMKLTRRSDIDVIYNAVDPMFTSQSSSFRVDQPRILHVGTAWNKNLENTIRALSGIPSELVIIGSVMDSVKTLLRACKVNYIIKEGLSDEALLMEYREADLITFCSIYEGFGMPIIEAHAVGRCVLTSSIPPTLEIAGGGAIFVDPNDVNSMASGFKLLISNPELRKALIEKGHKNVRRFEVKQIATLYLLVYESLTNSIRKL